MRVPVVLFTPGSTWMVRIETSREYCEGLQGHFDLVVLSESTAETPWGRLAWLSDVLQTCSPDSLRRVRRLWSAGGLGRKISPARLPGDLNDNQDTAVVSAIWSWLHPSLHLLYLLQKPNYPVIYRRTWFNQSSHARHQGWWSGLRKTTSLGTGGQPLDRWGPMSPDHIQSLCPDYYIQ